jgi:hypothetical protein
MNVISNWLVERQARVDARAGLDSVESRIVAELGPKPAFDPVGNPEHGQLAYALAERARVEELRDDLTRAENDAGNHAPASLLTLGFLFFVAVEAWGCFMVMKELGVRPTERLPLGIALALAVIGVTSVAAHRTAVRSNADGDRNGIGTRILDAAKRSVWTTLVLAAYTAVVGALAVLRVVHATSEDASPLEVVSQALLLVATSVGPAWTAEWLYRLRRPARAAEKSLHLIRRRLADAEKARERAQREVNRLAREGARWDIEASRRRAQYEVHHRLESKRAPDEQPSTKSPPRA